jgi:hypothetical protein
MRTDDDWERRAPNGDLASVWVDRRERELLVRAGAEAPAAGSA